MAEDPNYRSIFFAIPAASGSVETELVMGLFKEIGSFINRKWEMGLQFATGNNGIHMARNFLVRRFLDSPCTDLFFIDSDISWDAGALMRMIDHPVDFVLGLYRLKAVQEAYTYYADKDLVRDPDTGLIPIKAGPAGFMRLRRSVVEKMVETLPPGDEGGWMSEPMRPGYGIPTLFTFSPQKDPVTGLVHQAGEDMNFCLKWGEMGGQVWMDPDLNLHHIGKIAFSSNFWFSMNNKKQVLHDGLGGQEVRYPTGNGGLAKFEELTQGAAP